MPRPRRTTAGMFAPRKLVLIAAPFQFVGGDIGMGKDTYGKFRDNYARNPARALDKAWALIHQDDSRAEQVKAALKRQDRHAVLAKDWLAWLDAMDGFSFSAIPLGGMPETLLIHGDKDVVVAPEQAGRFVQALPKATLLKIKGAGHAPHWHNPEGVAAAIEEFTHV